MAAPPPQGSKLLRPWNLLTRAHSFFYRLSGGRLGGKMRGVPILLLEHVGRKSGQRRTTPLMCMEDGKDLVIVASRGGSPKHPAWWLNLRDSPETTIQFGGEKRRVRARQASPEEKARLWPRLVELYSDYEDYQRKTDREIPVIILSPA